MLSKEEKTELFETLTNGEKIEDRALAIAKLQDEFTELEETNKETDVAFKELEKSYLTTQQSMKQLLATRSVEEIENANGKEKEKEKEVTAHGFAKFNR